jgi:iron complex transport system ATP-binding protein
MLSIQSLTVDYKERNALDAVSLEVQAGEVMALIGPNGAGKSTLIRAVSGILPATSGRVLGQGQDLTEMAERKRARLISVVPQATNLGGAFTVEHTVQLGRTAFLGWLGVPGEEDQRQVDRALEQTDLAEFRERRVAELSGGEQQRVLVARALAQDAAVMLLDEPTNHLDLQHQSRLLGLVRQLAVDNNLAVLMALHDLNLVSLYSDRVGLLVEGQLRALGTPEEVLTEANICEAYQTAVQVYKYPGDGRTLILPNQP